MLASQFTPKNSPEKSTCELYFCIYVRSVSLYRTLTSDASEIQRNQELFNCHLFYVLQYIYLNLHNLCINYNLVARVQSCQKKMCFMHTWKRDAHNFLNKHSLPFFYAALLLFELFCLSILTCSNVCVRYSFPFINQLFDQ